MPTTGLCLFLASGLAILAAWYVSVVSTFPNTFALVLDSNLHDLNGTNPDWRCFLQNYHGVIYVREQTFSEWPETSRRHFSENKKNTCQRWRPGGPPPCHEGGGTPAPLGRAPYLVGPLALILLPKILINSKKCLRGFPGHSENFSFLHIKQHHSSSAETVSVRVSFIQVMQVRVQNKGKSVWKSRYVGDVSTPPSLNLCLSSTNSVDKLKVIKKDFYKLCLLLLL